MHVAAGRMTISPSSASSSTSSAHQPFVRRIVERRTVHSGAVRDRRTPASDAPLSLTTQEDTAVIGRPRVSFFNKLTSKFTKKY